MTYDQQILKILIEASGKALSVQAIAKHLYNMNCTFFNQPDYDEIRSYVHQYLLRNSKSPQSLVERSVQRGHYRLNIDGSTDARQMLLQFHDDQLPKEEETSPRQDFSLDLFSDI